MYGGKGGGFSLIAGGTIVLPNTGGHPILAIVADTSIAIGVAILLTILIKRIAKKIYA